MEGWIKQTISFSVIILVVVGAIFYIEFSKTKRMYSLQDECIEEYKSKLDGKQISYYAEEDCEQKVCEGFGLDLPGHGNWAKAVIYCGGKNGGSVIVRMPQYSDNQICEDYFIARWKQALCLESIGYINELT